MPNKTIFSENYVQINVDESNGTIYAIWKGFLKYDQVKTGCEVMTKYIKQHKTKSHLSDHRLLKILSREVQDYLQQEWFPTVEKEGLLKIGAVVADDVFAKASVDQVNGVKLGRMTINTFNSEKECEDWLQN